MIWLYLSLFSLLVFLIWNTLHESAHALVAKLYGAKDINLYIFPHKYQDNFYWARMSYSISEPMNKIWQWFFYMAPSIVDIICMTICIAAMPWPLWVLVFFAGAFVDFITNTFGLNDNSDLAKTAAVANDSRWSLRWARIGILLVYLIPLIWYYI